MRSIGRRLYFEIASLLTLAVGALAQPASPNTFINTGHTGSISQILYSGNGLLLTTSADDPTAKLWDLNTGDVLKLFDAPRGTLFALSPNGSQAASGHRNSVTIFDLKTGNPVRQLDGHTAKVTALTFSADGRRIASGSEDRSGRIWNLTTGQSISLSGHTDAIWHTTFSNDSRLLATADDHTLRLWDSATGRQIWSADYPQRVTRIDFLPGDREILVASYSTSAETPPLAILSARDGRHVRNLYIGGDNFTLFSISADGRRAIGSVFESTDQHHIFDLTRGVEIGRFGTSADPPPPGVVAINWTAVISPDGKQAVSGNSTGVLTVWDLASLKPIRKLGVKRPDLRIATLLPDNRALTALSDGNTRIWDLSSAAPAGDLTTAYPLALSSNNKFLLTTAGTEDPVYRDLNTPYEIGVRDLETGRSIRQMRGCITSGAISANASRAVIQCRNKTLVWDLTAQAPKLTPLVPDVDRQINKQSTAVAISPDGRTVAIQSDASVYLWDVATSRRIGVLEGHRLFITRLVFSADGRTIVSLSIDGEMIAWDLASRTLIARIEASPIYRSAAISEDGRLVATAQRGGNVGIWELPSGRLVRSLDAPLGSEELGFSPDRKRLLIARFGSAHIWNLETGKELVELDTFPDGEWIAFTPEGYFNASPKGDRYVKVRIGNSIYSIDQWRATFNKPKVVEAALATGDTARAVASIAAENPEPAALNDALPEPPFVVIKSPDNGARTPGGTVDVSFYVEDRRRPIRWLKLKVNGKEAAASDTRGASFLENTRASLDLPGDRRKFDLKVPVTLDNNENLIEVIAFNGIAEAKASVTVTAPSQRVDLPVAWVLAIGIDKYQSDQIQSLKYAAADAEAIAAQFASQRGKLFRQVNVRIISDRAPLKPTFDTIIDNFDFVKRAGQNDVVVLFIAGHGVNDPAGDFFFLPSDADIQDDGRPRRSRAISGRELMGVLDHPGKKILFLDTCHSEAAAGRRTRSANTDQLVRELSESGAVVFSSSRGREKSQESDEWRHGAFTYALLQGLSGSADFFKDGVIKMKALDAYVSETVPKITQGAQHPITNTPDGYANFPIALLGPARQ